MTEDSFPRANSHPRTLITGGAGFVGSHLCDRLIAEGHQVVCVDNLVTGRTENIQHLLTNPRFTFVQFDITSHWSHSSDGMLGNEKLDYILHFASPASPKDYARYPIETLLVGSVGTHHVLELAKEKNSVFVMASTSEVYGDPEVNPQTESYWGHVNPNGPRSCYDEAKRFSESITMTYHRQHGVAVRIARIFNTYGERMRLNDGRVLPNFLRQALRNQPVTIYGDGSQTRSLCYVRDLVDGIYRLMLSNETGPVNLGNPEEVSVSDLAREIIELTGSRSKIIFEPLPADDPLQRRPDISKAVASLGWMPRISRRQGIELVIPYFQSELERCERAEVSAYI